MVYKDIKTLVIKVLVQLTAPEYSEETRLEALQHLLENQDLWMP